MALPERYAYQLYPGPPLPSSEVAVLLLGNAGALRVDGLTALGSDWTEVIVLPGTHRIEWITRHEDDLSNGEDLRWLKDAARFVADLEAGHTYSIRGLGIWDETTAQPVTVSPWNVL